jgi:hypothetical protein
VEAFEWFLKEMAAECVECVADVVADDRLDVFQIKGGSLAYHFRSGSLGMSLCESSTWLNVQEVNRRFKDLLADPFKEGQFWIFPNKSQQPADQRWRTESLRVAFQLRNTAVHNVGVITHSDAIKLRFLSRETVQAPRLLTLTRQDLTYLKRFLDETARECNNRVGERLADLLTLIQNETPGPAGPGGSSQPNLDRIPDRSADRRDFRCYRLMALIRLIPRWHRKNPNLPRHPQQLLNRCKLKLKAQSREVHLLRSSRECFKLCHFFLYSN